MSFHDPDNVKDPVKEEASNSVELSMDDLETWLEYQAGQLGTLTWRGELAAVSGIKIGINLHGRSEHHSMCLGST